MCNYDFHVILNLCCHGFRPNPKSVSSTRGLMEPILNLTVVR